MALTKNTGYGSSDGYESMSLGGEDYTERMLGFGDSPSMHPPRSPVAAPVIGGVDLTALGTPGRGAPTLMQRLLGYSDADGKQNGILPAAIGTFSGLASIYMGMKQYGLAKDSFKENKRQFNDNFNASAQSYNTQLADRQDARNSSNRGNTYQSTRAYMNDNEIQRRTA